MSKVVLTIRQKQLIQALCGTSDRLNAALGEKIISGTLSPSDVEKLCEIISNEFLMKGIREDFEPNDYGIELEELLDAVNRDRLRH